MSQRDDPQCPTAGSYAAKGAEFFAQNSQMLLLHLPANPCSPEDSEQYSEQG